MRKALSRIGKKDALIRNPAAVLRRSFGRECSRVFCLERRAVCLCGALAGWI
jgi:hypothetical protein